MKAAGIRFVIKPGASEEFAARVKEIFDKTNNTPGLQAVYLVEEPNKNIFMTFAVWETEQSAEAWAQNKMFQKFNEDVKHLLVAESEREIYNIRAYTASNLSHVA